MKTVHILKGLLLMLVVVGIAMTPSMGMAIEPLAEVIMLCDGCGAIKGSETCCSIEAPQCDVCGLQKGSPACCKGIDFSEGPVTLCASCGEVKGSEACCDAEAPQCAACGLIKGSPGCCKI